MTIIIRIIIFIARQATIARRKRASKEDDDDDVKILSPAFPDPRLYEYKAMST